MPDVSMTMTPVSSVQPPKRLCPQDVLLHDCAAASSSAFAVYRMSRTWRLENAANRFDSCIPHLTGDVPTAGKPSHTRSSRLNTTAIDVSRIIVPDTWLSKPEVAGSNPVSGVIRCSSVDRALNNPAQHVRESFGSTNPDP